LIGKMRLCTHLSVHRKFVFMNTSILKHIIPKIVMIFVHFVWIARIQFHKWIRRFNTSLKFFILKFDQFLLLPLFD
jgi:hypothetical protein